jgi:hypothetical protein
VENTQGENVAGAAVGYNHLAHMPSGKLVGFRPDWLPFDAFCDCFSRGISGVAVR